MLSSLLSLVFVLNITHQVVNHKDLHQYSQLLLISLGAVIRSSFKQCVQLQIAALLKKHSSG